MRVQALTMEGAGRQVSVLTCSRQLMAVRGAMVQAMVRAWGFNSTQAAHLNKRVT